jgi:phage baseplate assembly protein W
VPTFQTFRDLSIAFKPHPVTGDVVTKKDTAAIRQAVSNLLYTRKTERFFDSELGTNLQRLLFEPLSSITAGLISEEIKNVLTRYEPRISIESIEVNADRNQNGFEVLLYFVIVGRNDGPISLDLFLERP